jgi:hypothetical protein
MLRPLPAPTSAAEGDPTVNLTVETDGPLNSLARPGALLFAVAVGVVIGGLAVWGAQWWREEQAYQAWRTRKRPAVAWRHPDRR